MSKFGEGFRYAASCGKAGIAVVIDEQLAKRCPAQPHRLLQHRVEYWSKIAGRGVDDLQYLGGCGLVFESFL